MARNPYTKFSDQRRRLKIVFKQWKAGLLKEENITDHVKDLLTEYYGVKFTTDIPKDDGESESDMQPEV